MTAPKMKEVKIAFYPDQLQSIDEQAASQGMSRSQFVRERAIATQPTSTSTSAPTFNRGAYVKAVEAAAQTVPGLPRAQVEWVVSRVINTLAS